MTEDLVERLNKHVFYGDARWANWKRHSPLAMDAAAEIERLRARVAELERAIIETLPSARLRVDV